MIMMKIASKGQILELELVENKALFPIPTESPQESDNVVSFSIGEIG